MAEEKEKKTAKRADYPDTPSGKALAEVGDLDGEDVKHHKEGETEKALEHGEAYQAAKRKYRWG
jgi:hypothetical protein